MNSQLRVKDERVQAAVREKVEAQGEVAKLKKLLDQANQSLKKAEARIEPLQEENYALKSSNRDQETGGNGMQDQQLLNELKRKEEQLADM